MVSGCYSIGELEAEDPALTPEIERSPSAKLPGDPVYERFDLALFERALSEAWAEPAPTLSSLRPYRGTMTAPDLRLVRKLRPIGTDPSMLFFLIIADHDQGFFSVEGPMTDRRALDQRRPSCPRQFSPTRRVRPKRSGSKHACC